MIESESWLRLLGAAGGLTGVLGSGATEGGGTLHHCGELFWGCCWGRALGMIRSCGCCYYLG